jgi:hypothetical protein
VAVVRNNPASVVRIDRPDLRETFVDSVQSLVWDGQTVRVELCVTRYPETASGGDAHRYPTARLVMTVQALSDLFNRLQQTMPVLEQAGLIAKAQPPAAGS